MQETKISLCPFSAANMNMISPHSEKNTFLKFKVKTIFDLTLRIIVKSVWRQLIMEILKRMEDKGKSKHERF